MTERKKTLRIGFLGAGAIGAYVGACLSHLRPNSDTEVEVVLVGRDSLLNSVSAAGNVIKIKSFVSAQQKLIDKRGSNINIESPSLRITSDPLLLADMDIVIVSVKATATEEAGLTLQNVFGKSKNKDCIVFSFQNGIGNRDILEDFLPSHNVLASMVEFNVMWRREGASFHQTTGGLITIEENNRAAHDVRFNLFSKLLTKTGFQTKVVPSKQIREILYGKLLVNLINPVNALSGETIPETLANSKWRDIYAACWEEALQVYEVAGITPAKIKANPKLMPSLLRLPTWLFQCIQFFVAKLDKETRTSMLQDFLNGQKTEIDFINGQVVKLAEQNGADAPINKKMVSLIHSIEAEHEKNRKGKDKMGYPLTPTEVANYLGL